MWIFLIVLAICLFWFLKPKPILPKLDGVYSQQYGLWFLVNKLLLTAYLSVVAVYRRWHRKNHVKEEVEQFRFDIPLAPSKANELSFTTSDKFGNILTVRLSRGSGLAEAGLVVRLADGSVLTQVSHGELTSELVSMDETPFGDEADPEYISAGGIRIRAVDPARTYRILYSGLMNLKTPTGNKLVPVDIRLWFRFLTDPVDFQVDFCPCQVANCLSKEDMPLSSVFSFTNPETVRRQQAGEIRGYVQISETEPIELALHGHRDYVTGRSQAINNNGFFALRVRLERGLILSLHADCQPDDGISHLVSGFLFHQNGYVYPVSWSDIHLSRLPKDCNIPQQMAFNLKSHGQIFTFEVEVLTSRKTRRTDPTLMTEQQFVVYENFVKVTREQDGQIGYGTIEFNPRGQHCVEPSKTAALRNDCFTVFVKGIPKPALPEPRPQCVRLSDPVCRHTELTGGKAAKLADILACVGNLPISEVDMSIPDGFTITSAAFENHLKIRPELGKKIRMVRNLASMLNQAKEDGEQAKRSKELEEACNELHDEFLSTKLDELLEEEIEQHLKASFGNAEWNATVTAVRSSAVGEDGSEASGAGQMETFLGVQGKHKILEAVRKCWASHYSFRAIQYRRQLCAKLDSPMAVLVQRLINADVAGVLFTRHPDTGSTAQMVINASYGIGESVVSGSVQPDTISVFKRGGDIEIAYDNIGEKTTALRLNEASGILQEETVTASKKVCCLSESELRRLWAVGRLLERCFGSSRDVEFAIEKATKGKSTILILQARPITTADMESEWELMHEFDTPLASDLEWVITSNVQEMMPGALAPLSAQVWNTAIGPSLEVPQVEIALKPGRRLLTHRCGSMFYQHGFINWTMIGAALYDQFEKVAADMSIFGKEVKEITIEHLVEQNDMASKFWRKKLEFYMWRDRLFPSKRMDKLEDQIHNYPQPSGTDPKEVHKYIADVMAPFARKVWAEHIFITMNASMLPSVLMLTLDKSMNWGPQIYEDMAMMLSSCTDVFSADVPTLLQDIATSIKGDDEAAKFFIEATRAEGAQWLLSSTDSGHHGQLFRNFLKKHGHRCVRDSDIRETSWIQEPEKVVDALNVMVASDTAPTNVNQHKRVLSVDEAIAALKTPINGRIQRAIIKMFLPKARAAVGRREWAKSLGIEITDHLRRAYYRLAALLTEKGYLPDEDLMFFLSMHELEILIDRRSPKLIAKALRRRKFFSKFNNLEFKEIDQGHSKILVDNLPPVPSADGSGVHLKGLAVGNGCVQGVARVVTNLAEANKIKNGDILIVPYTDVGWTPYFPLISGLVTELGGLISHGAVVAREYGLPCIVGCKKATDLIKTGDRVYVDGHLGEIRVLE